MTRSTISGGALAGDAVGLGLFDRLFDTLAAHLVGVPAVVADELEALVGDALPDLVISGAEVLFYKNTGRPTHPAFMDGKPVLTSGGAKLSGRVAVGDLNGDALPDIVLGDPNSATLRFCENIGPAEAPRFADPVAIEAGVTATQLGQGVFPVICDFDGDGRNDLLVMLQQSSELYWLSPARKP